METSKTPNEQVLTATDLFAKIQEYAIVDGFGLVAVQCKT